MEILKALEKSKSTPSLKEETPKSETEQKIGASFVEELEAKKKELLELSESLEAKKKEIIKEATALANMGKGYMVKTETRTPEEERIS